MLYYILIEMYLIYFAGCYAKLFSAFFLKKNLRPTPAHCPPHLHLSLLTTMTTIKRNLFPKIWITILRCAEAALSVDRSKSYFES